MKIFKEDMDKLKINSNKCPSKETRFHIVKGTDNVFNFNEYYKEDADNEFSTIPDCDEAFFNSNQKGCCKKANPNNEDNVLNKSDHNTGLKFLYNDTSYNVYHKNPVKQVFNSILNDPDKIRKFFTLIAISILSLLVTAIIGTCYEFWLRYGTNIECIYFDSDCLNTNKKQNGITNLVDHMFPDSLCYYPYRNCDENKYSQTGGFGIDGRFKSQYSNSDKQRCRTINKKTSEHGFKRFPYNLPDWGKNNIESEYINTILKAFTFFFLFPILFVRIVFNKIFTFASDAYHGNQIETKPIISNLIFLLLTGLIFSILSAVTSGGINIAFAGPQVYLNGFIFLITVIMTFGLLGTLIITIFPESFFERLWCNMTSGEKTITGNAQHLKEYYKLFSGKLLYHVDKTLSYENIKNIILNILLIIFVLPLIFVLTYMSGMIGWFLGTFWMTSSFSLKLFTIPISNINEFLDILKSHGDLLTILFCIGIIGSSALSLNPTTTGIMGMLLAFIVLYKVFKSFKKN